VEVIEVQQHYRAEPVDLIPKCFRNRIAENASYISILIVLETLSLILFQQTCQSLFGNSAWRVRRLAGASSRLIALVALFVAALLMPFTASATSIRQYENESRTRQSEIVATAIDKIVADVAKVNPDISKAIHNYFYVIPKGQPESPGLIAFAGDLNAAEDAADKGKVDLDKIQIEGLLLGIVKRDVLHKQVAQEPEKK
jgi:hypothetical protein